MAVLTLIIRSIVAVVFGFAALGNLISGGFLGALVMLAGCAIIAPPGGAWLARKISPLNSNSRQVLLGVALVFVGVFMSMARNTDQAKPAAVAASIPPAPAPPAPPKFQCERGTVAEGAVVEVLGADGHDLRQSPDGERIVNEKATKALGSIQYQTIDNTTKVRVECIDGDWARVQITSPNWLTEQKGWVAKAALAMPLKPGEVRDFTEDDFWWDKDTEKHKEVIMKTVNRIHREDPRCKDAIYPSSVAKSDTESKAQKKAVYFVNCGDGATSVNVYFDAKRADDPTPFRSPGHIDQARAVDLCEAYARQSATHPSTVDFSRIMDLAISEHPNGRTMILSSFEAKNAFNLELKFKIKCLLDENGFIEGQIWEEGT